MKTIAVGVDGSPGAKAAIEFAAREAAAHGAVLRLVATWEVPPAVLASAGVGPDVYQSFQEDAGEIAAEAAALVASVEPGVTVEERVVEGHAGEVLVDQSKEVDLLVVGRRGRGGFAGLLLGSVSQHVMHHSACPVVIVPPVKTG
jgi:nucleotide-binding universal stress UspA family protein